ncbi:transferase hexapeptide repeat family protein [Marinobacterium sp. LSUCC0821]|uniref:acyltransferase n=1 Tax=Marinobacterium sp. LSUCC0821 TaxID=2668067 RepID=UPI0014519235|nr:transferase hexapeptide repeat family protein [Marinobacterium sp. LSUCC0821]QJD71498.1 transferase hexapeptide repeat family protein [Marinobacterium sp. LSUCC0821]
MPVYQIDGVTPVVHPSSYVHPTAVIIGDVIIGPDCYIGPLASLRGDFGPIHIGRGVNIQDSCVVHSFQDITVVIEDYAHIGHCATLHGCHIKAGVLVGMSATVMDKAVVGERSFVAAHSFVKTGDQFDAERMILGTPAKDVRALSSEEMAWKHSGTEAYIELGRRSKLSCIETEALAEVEENRPTIKFETKVDTKQETLAKKSGDEA